MCGLIGIVNKENGKFPVDLLRSLMLEARIRGQHATGIAYRVDHQGRPELKVHIEPRPVNEFVLPDDIYDADAVILHTRYSTSDLQWNQPNYAKDSALIHNGVVTQADPSTWKEEFGVDCKTRNDSEILLHMMLGNVRGKHPLDLVNTSQACIYLDAGYGKMMFWRNEQRPLYYVDGPDFLVVASTKDIMVRAGIPSNLVWSCKPCVEYQVDIKSGSLTNGQVRIPNEDLQEEF